jgi:hypothetical protein
MPGLIRAPYAFTGDDPIIVSSHSASSGAAVGMAHAALVSSGDQRSIANSAGWPSGDLREAISKNIGPDVAIESTTTGKIVFSSTEGFYTGVVLDPSGGYFRVEREYPGLAPEYLMSNGQWIDQLKLNWLKNSNPEEWAQLQRISHFYNDGPTPSTLEEAQQWISEIPSGSASDIEGDGEFHLPVVPED